MRRMSERGDSRLGTLIFFALLFAVGLAAWNLIPVYYGHYDLTDAVEEICRTPVYKARTPQIIKDMLLKEVRNREMEKWVFPDSFQISTGLALYSSANSAQSNLAYILTLFRCVLDIFSVDSQLRCPCLFSF